MDQSKIVAKTTARLLYGSNGGICSECGAAYERKYYGDKVMRVCVDCEKVAWREFEVDIAIARKHYGHIERVRQTLFKKLFADAK